jgi:predicted adenylyl cyclase CyaB
MIEVEKKFSPTKKQLKRLLIGAEFLKEIIIKDTYFDTKDFSLILKDKWLRLRGKSLELKLPLGPIGHTEASLDLYDEITNENKILKILNLPKDININNVLEKGGYKAVASFITTRRKYKKEGFNIDVDALDFGYNLVEIETLISDNSKMEKAGEKILNFAIENGLTVNYVRGKFVEYVFRKNRKLYNAMREAGFFPNL